MALLWLAIAFLTGVAAASLIALPLAVPVVGFVLGGTVAVRRLLPGLVVIAAALGMLRVAFAPVHDALAPFDGHAVQLQGVIAAEPDVRDTGANYVVSVQSVSWRGRSYRLSAAVAVHTSSSVVLQYADAVSVTGRLVRPVEPYRSAYLHQGITATLSYPRILDDGQTVRPVIGGVVALRQRLEAGIDRWIPEPYASLLVGITLGTHSADLGTLSSILIATGLIHIIAISGIKVAIVAGTVFAVLRRLARRGMALILALLVIWSYVALTGGTVSGERSALMWSLVFVAGYLGRNTVALVSLGVAAALMVAFSPALLFDPAYQLSVIGTCGIVAFTNPIHHRIRYMPSPFGEAFAVTVAAQVATLHVVLDSFHVLALLGPLANALVLPFLPLLIVAGFALGAVAPISAVAAPLSALITSLLQLLVFIAGALASFPAAPSVSVVPALIPLYDVAILSAAYLALLRSRWSPVANRPRLARELVLGVSAALLLASVTAVHTEGSVPPSLQSLGDGDALVLRSGHQIALIDGGPHPFQLLAKLGHVIPPGAAIDLIVVTDPRSGNVEALDQVLHRYRVGEVVDVGIQYPSATYARWRSDVRARHIPAFLLRTGLQTRLGAVRITALGPDALYPDPKDCIGLLRLDAGNRSIVIAGSASPREQLEAVFRPVHLRAGLLLLDGKRGLSPPFLHRVGGTVRLETSLAPLTNLLPHPLLR